MHDALTIRQAIPSDASSIVDVHLESFEGFFLSSLGPYFLRLFYEGLIDLPGGVLMVALDGSSVVGFVGGATEQVDFYRNLLRTRRVRFTLAAAAASLRHPRVVPRLLRARHRGAGRDETKPGPSLMTLGVSPRAEGQGVGRALVERFGQEIARRGQNSFSLTTDAVGNDRTNRFYQALGLRLVRVISTPEGRQLNVYEQELNVRKRPRR